MSDLSKIDMRHLHADLAACYGDVLAGFLALQDGITTLPSGGNVFDRIVKNLEMASIITAEMRARASAQSLRPVCVKQNPRSSLPEYEALFHQWATFADESGSAVYAIVERNDGQVVTVDAHLIVFLDRTEASVDQTKTQERA
jgi:hypothetical protein